MTKQQAIKKLEKNNYKVIACMQGGYIAKKYQRIYIAETLNGLIKKIFH